MGCVVVRYVVELSLYFEVRNVYDDFEARARLAGQRSEIVRIDGTSKLLKYYLTP